MKISRTFIFVLLASLLMTACQSDDGQTPVASSQGEDLEQTSVNFELDASAIKYEISDNPTLKFSPTYSASGFKIYAFKRVVGGVDYKFEKEITLSNIDYSVSDKKLKGDALLSIGTYKFLSAYGVQQNGVLTIPTWSNQTLSNDFAIEYNGTSTLNEIFLQDGDVSTLQSYDLGLTSATNPVVAATLKRAVSRVDIMFFKGKKENGVYSELPYTASDAFGKKTLETLQLRYKGLNPKMNFFGDYMSAPAINSNLNLSNFSEIVTIGNATATKVGDEEYAGYDNVVSEDLINGAAHVFGNYTIPNAENAAAITNLELYIKPVNGEGRVITLADKLPMDKNKVTLVKIYILDSGNGPEEPNVFTTNVKFEVEIETVWNGSNEVTGEIN